MRSFSAGVGRRTTTAKLRFGVIAMTYTNILRAVRRRTSSTLDGGRERRPRARVRNPEG